MLSRFKRSPFFKNLFILASGTALAQAISVVTLPIFQKLYTPRDFSALQLFNTITILFTAFATLKLEYAILLPKKDADARRLISVTLSWIFFNSFITLAIVYCLSEWLLPDVSPSEKKLMLWCIPVTVFFSGAYETLTFWHNRYHHFKLIAASKLMQNSSMEAFRLLNYFVLNKPGGLVIGRFAGFLASAFFLGKSYISSKGFVRVDAPTVRSVFKKYYEFPLFTMPTVFISALTNYIFIFFFIKFYGRHETGLVSVANQYIALPLGIIASSFSQVFYNKIAPITSPTELYSLYKRFSFRLLTISLILAAAAFAVPDHWPSKIVGSNWGGLMPYIRVTVIWQGMAFISSSLSFIYVKLGKQRIMFFFAVLQLSLVYIALVSSGRVFDDPFRAFLLYVIVQAAYYLFAILSAFYFIRTTPLDGISSSQP